MEYATIPNCQYKVFLKDYPETTDALVIVTTMDGRELYKAAYRSEKIAINAIKRRLKIDLDRKNLLIYKPENERWQTKGWR